MEISLLKMLVNGISSFLNLSFSGNINSEPISKYYQKAEEILRLLKPIIDAIAHSELASDEVLSKIFEELGHAIDELREHIENWHLLSSKVYFAMQVEPLISRIRTLGLNIFQQLKVSQQCLPDELSSEHLEHCVQKLKHLGHEEVSAVIKEAITEQREGLGPSSEVLAKIADSLGLKSNQEVLIEAVALEKLKENAEQTEKTAEAEYIDQMIAVVTHMHERLSMLKQAESSSPVPVPADFCCPLSLELMTDPVIVASGQTYERAFIRNWIDLGLTVCPKTRQALAHTNLIPNYTVKALIATWCESNNVKLVEPSKSTSLNQASVIQGYMESGTTRDSPVFSHSRGNQPSSPESARSHSFSSPGNNISSAGIQREGTSPLHPRSISEGSLSGMVNGQHMDLAGAGLDDRSASSDESSVDSVGQPSMSPSKRESSGAFIPDQAQAQAHVRTISYSSALSSGNFPQETPGDDNSSPQLSSSPAYSRDVSGELNPGLDSASAATVPSSHREPEFPPRSETRSRTSLWQRPSQRLVPRMASSPAAETRADLSAIESQVRKLVEGLKSTNIDTQREATVEIRLLAKHNMDNRIAIANCGAITILVELLRSPDTRIQENAVTALLNLSINDNNKSAIANAGAIEPLIHVLKTGSPEAKENSAATLFSLSVIEENKISIGRSGAIGPLVDLLGNGTPRGKKDAATALFNLSIFHENKNRIVQAGAVKHLVELMDPAAGMVDKAVAVLANLATIQEGRVAIGQEGGIPVLVEVVELGSARGKENAAAALLHLCLHSNRFLSMVLQEGAVPPLVALSQSGTPRAKEKAQALLNQFRSQRHNAGRG
ncbi:U-box domain-containing protein 4 isoform X1 [Arachis stenosperma]|uniref:U-box domain-containing protein 4 isoform X1 n=1 Tax=Arachis stenosperma TaxID=217475 RepID=UPI0025ACEB56|nr:U-box domain-containing protein 4 isoform X1 [Arachis stenosperma]XP_057745073.1 U-box domain-containing protein 4 isoform X1 [Arachis stenosperma]